MKTIALKPSELHKLKYSKINREINQKHVLMLEQMIKKSGVIMPISISKDYLIIDGQHRVEVAKRLNLSLSANIINVNEKFVRNVNIYKSWDTSDWLNTFRDKPDYLQFAKLFEKYPQSLITKFGVGDLKKGNFKFLFKYEEIELILSQISLIANALSKKPERSLLVALFNIITKTNIPDFEIKVLNNKSMFQSRSSANDYIILLEEMYNYRNRNKINLRFEVKK
jgi:hypothetical protein